jgi:hypothetical protein
MNLRERLTNRPSWIWFLTLATLLLRCMDGHKPDRRYPQEEYPETSRRLAQRH